MKFTSRVRNYLIIEGCNSRPNFLIKEQNLMKFTSRVRNYLIIEGLNWSPQILVKEQNLKWSLKVS